MYPSITKNPVRFMSKNFYEILGVSHDASEGDIKKAYRRLARKWHPDINPGNKKAEQEFKEISRAYECLGKKNKRKLYDEFGEEGIQSGFDAEKARQYRQWNTFQKSAKAGTGPEFGRYHSYEDVFGDIFGFGAGHSNAGAAMASRGRDLEHNITVDLISALKGFETELNMQKIKACPECQGTGTDPRSQMTTCTSCGGSGRLNVSEGPMQFTKPCPKCKGHGKTGNVCTRCAGNGRILGTEKIRVTIPQGVKEGSKVRVAEKGEPGLNGGRPGDLYLIIHLKAHPYLKREDDDLYMDVPVTVSEAMKGGTIAIPTIDGQTKIKVPPKSQSGQILRLKGKGAMNLKTKKRGNLMVKLIVKVPETDDGEILEAAEKMEKYYKRDLREGIRL